MEAYSGSEKQRPFKGFSGKWNLICLALVVCLALWLDIWGITMGLPSRERLRQSIGNPENIAQALPEIQAFMRRGGAQRTEFADKTDSMNFIELSRFSPYFDQVRSYNPDEFYTLKTLAGMVKRRDILPRSYIYGSFYIYQVGAALAVGRAVGYLPKQAGLGHYLMNPEEFARFYICGRIFCLIYGALAVIVVFLIGYRLGNTPLAVFASTFLACMPLVALASKFIKPDAPMLFWTAMALLVSLPILERARWIDYILSGICIGLAAGCKYPAAFSALYPVTFHLLRISGKDNKFDKSSLVKDFMSRKQLMLVGAGLVSIITFIIVTPAILLDAGTFFHDLNWIVSLSYDGPFLRNLFFNLTSMCNDAIFYTLGVFGWLAIVGGIVFAFIRPRKVWLGLLPMIIIFIFLASKGLPTSDAYLMPAFVPMALLAGRLVLAPKWLWVKAALAVIVLGSVLSYAIAWDCVAASENSRINALRWINRNIQPGCSIATLRYPVSYRVPIPNPAKYRLFSEQMDGKRALRSDYYLDSSFQWTLDPPIQDHLSGVSTENKPHGYKKLMEFENPPRAYFGLYELRRPHRVNLYFEAIAPRVILYEKKQR